MWVARSAGPAVSAFQKRVRGQQTVLKDHICKEMNGLNLERCRCIPKDQPGADWRVLQQIVEQDPAREKFQVRPSVYSQVWTRLILVTLSYRDEKGALRTGL